MQLNLVTPDPKYCTLTANPQVSSRVLFRPSSTSSRVWIVLLLLTILKSYTVSRSTYRLVVYNDLETSYYLFKFATLNAIDSITGKFFLWSETYKLECYIRKSSIVLSPSVVNNDSENYLVSSRLTSQEFDWCCLLLITILNFYTSWHFSYSNEVIWLMLLITILD